MGTPGGCTASIVKRDSSSLWACHPHGTLRAAHRNLSVTSLRSVHLPVTPSGVLHAVATPTPWVSRSRWHHSRGTRRGGSHAPRSKRREITRNCVKWVRNELARPVQDNGCHLFG